MVDVLSALSRRNAVLSSILERCTDGKFDDVVPMVEAVPSEIKFLPRMRLLVSACPQQSEIDADDNLDRARTVLWDSQHGEVEVYGKDRGHQGAFDPNTGEQKPGKGPKKGRRCPTGLF